MQDNVTLVQSSWSQVAKEVPNAGDVFYANLFSMAPELRPMFKGDTSEQGRKLVQMISVAVSKLDRPDDLLPALKSLGERHRGYGVKTEHYATVGNALVVTLRQALGEAWDDATEHAWLETYALLSGAMNNQEEAS